ncbi:MAG: methyltransferase domain-containing protein [Lachnospiraceae bacterium]|nr:methyltransferase domain-containing protein [Lachnospiraceae bacterium]
MHKSSFLRMEYLLKWYKPLWDNNNIVNILDVGSYDQNGTYKVLFSEHRYKYTGLDLEIGPNVDVVPNDIYSWDEISDNQFDLIISGQVFEHIEFPWLTIKEIHRVLKPSGICIISAPNAGIEHKAPTDCYRFFSDGMIALAKWANLNVLHTSVAGIPRKNGMLDWVSEWNDVFTVLQKNPITGSNYDDPFIYEYRLLQDGMAHIAYKNEDIAVNEIIKKFDDTKKFIIFGAGEYGERILKLFGSNRVFCFGDNSKDKIGRTIAGKKILSLDEIKKIFGGYHVVVAANYTVSVEIKKQLERERIPAETLYLEG